jgi:urease accessory protein
VDGANRQDGRPTVSAQTSHADGWHGHLALRYACEGARTTAHDAHSGPLRVLKALYPEGEGICHHVLVHPPGGVVGGDVLNVDVQVATGAQALITTPGATRFYRSAGALAVQRCTLTLHTGARLEWLPLEAIAYPSCRAENRVVLDLQGNAQIIGWDMLALGLPASGAPFDAGVFTQSLHWPGRWREHGRIDAQDMLLRRSPLGLANHSVLATLWLASGEPLPAAQVEALLGDAREAASQRPTLQAGSTAPDAHLVLLRVLAPQVEAAWHLLRAVRAAWRQRLWGLSDVEPRVWRT